MPMRRRVSTLSLLVAMGGLPACGQSSVPIAASGGVPDAPPAAQEPGPPANLLSLPLEVAVPRVVPLSPQPDSAPRPLSTHPADWNGQLANLAGTAHYDRGEWIYEDYPWTAHGAASALTVPVYQLLDLLGNVYGPADRIPGGLAIVIAQAGAGPFVDEADLSELRLALRGDELHLRVRTTTMQTPVRTALLLLFDTGRAGTEHAVPFGSGLRTQAADTAVLVTANGTRIVDLVTGSETSAPAIAEPSGYLNAMATALPLSLVSMPGDSQLRLVGASGVVAPGSFELQSTGAGGPIAKVVPRFNEPVQSVHDRKQALALAARNIDRFLVSVSLDRMRAGDRELLLPGIGYSVRTHLVAESRSSEGGTNGTLRQYGLYVPKHFTDEPTPATLLLRGSSMTAHGLAAITPGLFQNLGDDNGAIIVSPCGRSGFDMFQGAVYVDVLDALADAEALLPIDADRISLAGYSMGGYATYMFAATQPDRFAGAFAIAGLVGGNRPATSTLRFPDVVPMLANLLHNPVAIFQGDVDINVPIIHALAASSRLRQLGYRYRYNLLLANTHFSPGLQNDYSIAARYLKSTRRETAPSRVHLTRIMPYERWVDSGATSDQPLAGQSMGLRFDDAWYLRELEPVDPVNGTATADVRTLARPAGPVTPVMTYGMDAGPLTGQPLSPFEELSWVTGPAADAPRNAFTADLSGTSRVALDLAQMALRTDEALAATIRTDTEVVIALRLPEAGCLAAPATVPAQMTADAYELRLAAGEHAIELHPCVP